LGLGMGLFASIGMHWVHTGCVITVCIITSMYSSCYSSYQLLQIYYLPCMNGLTGVYTYMLRGRRSTSLTLDLCPVLCMCSLFLNRDDRSCALSPVVQTGLHTVHYVHSLPLGVLLGTMREDRPHMYFVAKSSLAATLPKDPDL
jgi:hypothetical protein